MDFNKACVELEINSPFSLSELKKQYRIMALKNHPDKHIPDIDNIYSEKFKNISASYEYLITFLEEIIPGFDVIPSFTLMWLYTYVFKKSGKNATVEI